MPTVEELLALDLLTLREHTERAGEGVFTEWKEKEHARVPFNTVRTERRLRSGF